jgi:dTDP-4-amino-4,6-dideoxygalactose transaminase
MKVPFLDLRVLDAELKREMLRAIETVMDHGRILLGPEVDALERELAAYCGVKHALAVGSGTDALVLAVRALGLGAGDEVITPAITFVGTANGIALAGAKPAFCDVTPDLVMDPARIAAAITPHTKAVMPVHFTGRMPNMDAIAAICRKHDLILIEDAAPGIGAERNGKRAGSFGKVGCLSINPMKVLNALGEAGAVLTDDDAVFERLSILRYHGVVNKESCVTLSHNARIDTLQAAVIRPRLKRLEQSIAHRRSVAARYNRAFKGLFRLPQETPGHRDVYYTYTIQSPDRDKLAEHLMEAGVETRVQHPMIIPQHPLYRETDLTRYPVAMKAASEVLCLPCHEKLDDAQVDYTIRAVAGFFSQKRA